MSAQHPDDQSNLITVTEAVEVGLRDDGSPHYQYRKVRRHRPQPPSLREFIAALSRVRRHSMTAEQHRALVEHWRLAATSRFPRAGGNATGKATVSRPEGV
jgi:hypothetical protein